MKIFLLFDVNVSGAFQHKARGGNWFTHPDMSFEDDIVNELTAIRMGFSHFSGNFPKVGRGSSRHFNNFREIFRNMVFFTKDK